jgi:RNA polymerase sigma-70 factor (ECF subfamily)
VYRDFYREVCRWVRAFGGLDADADDLAQEVFLVVRRRLDAFDGENLAGWLYEISRRTASQYRRNSWLRRMFQPSNRYFEQLPEEKSGPDELAERKQSKQHLQAVLSHLSRSRRAAFILYEIEGYTGEEIAALEGVPVNTIYTRLHYARRDFLNWLEKLERKNS